MISEPTYLAAKLASHRIAAHFSEQSEIGAGVGAEYLPDIAVVETLLDTAFWASLRREEGYEPKISLVFATPETTYGRLIFTARQRLTPYHLVKLSPAVVQPGIHLGVWMDENGFYIWGTAHEVPPYSMVVEVVEAGLLVVKQRKGYTRGKLVNVAVLRGNQIKIVDDNHWGLTECPGILSSLLGLSKNDGADNVMVQLALALRRHGRGALLLVVPQGSSAWQHSIVKPINYLIEPATMFPLATDSEVSITQAESMRKMVDAVGGYSAIDGATVITRDQRVLAFGAKVARSPYSVPVAQLVITEPTAGSEMLVLDATAIGGTRHLAAAQFVHDQHDALAMVASQDGTFTVFVWSEKQQMVHGHRIDVLLM